MFSQATREFIVLLGFGSSLFLFGLLLFINPRMLWKWDKKWLSRKSKKTKNKPPVTYDVRQRMGALITMGFGVTLLVAALYTVIIYKPWG